MDIEKAKKILAKKHYQYCKGDSDEGFEIIKRHGKNIKERHGVLCSYVYEFDETVSNMCKFEVVAVSKMGWCYNEQTKCWWNPRPREICIF